MAGRNLDYRLWLIDDKLDVPLRFMTFRVSSDNFMD